MRVLIVPEWYPWPDRPYFGVFCREQARAVAADHEVVVLTWRCDPALRGPLRLEDGIEDGVRTLRVRFWQVPVPKLDGAARLAGCLVALSRLRRSGWVPDVIHAHEYGVGRTALTFARLMRAALVVSEHYNGFALGTVPARQRAEAQRVFERAAIVCPVGRDLERRLREVAPRARFEVVPNAVDTEVFRPAAGANPVRAGGPLRVVSVGSLVEVKGHRFLLEAVAELAREAPVVLDLVGDGPLRGELTALADALELAGCVRFHGACSRHCVAEALRNADVFVLPSLWETMSCALVEAMACGLPSVATRVGDVPEVLGEAGVVVDPGSAAALAAGIRAIRARPEAYDRASNVARTTSRYGYDAIGSRWSAVYSAAVASTKHPS